MFNSRGLKLPGDRLKARPVGALGSVVRCQISDASKNLAVTFSIPRNRFTGIWHLISGILLLFLLTGCLSKPEPDVAGGGATETGNTLTGIILLENGDAAINVPVTLLPGDFNPFRDSSAGNYYSGVTDSLGTYEFTELPDGTFNLFAEEKQNSQSLLIQEIELEGDEIHQQNGVLQNVHTITIPLSQFEDKTTGTIYIPGTLVGLQVDPELEIQNFVQLTSVPQGLHPSIIYEEGSVESAVNMLASPIQIADNDTTLFPFADWGESAILTFNISGTLLSENLLNFPMLLRLNSDNFDFSQTESQGQDLRITNRFGVTLPHEITSWNAESQTASIWISQDTLIAGEAHAGIRMFWGKKGVENLSDGAAVFSAASHFSGVWHLNEQGTNTGAGYKDAGSLGNHGTGTLMETSEAAQGVISHGQNFADSLAQIRIENNASLNFATGDFSVSAWIKVDSLAAGDPPEQIINKRSDTTGNYEMQLSGRGKLWGYFKDGEIRDTISSRDLVPQGVWTHVAMTRKENVAALYINGELNALKLILEINVDSDSALTIGRDPLANNEFFGGNIDEVRVENTARSEDWFKAVYQTQKPGARVTFSGL